MVFSSSWCFSGVLAGKISNEKTGRFEVRMSLMRGIVLTPDGVMLATSSPSEA